MSALAASLGLSPAMALGMMGPAGGGGPGMGGMGGMPAPPLRHPLSVRGKQTQIMAKIGGLHTEIVLSAFADRIVVLITQIDKVAALLTATVDSPAPGAMPTGISAAAAAAADAPAPAFTVTTLIGYAHSLTAPLRAPVCLLTLCCAALFCCVLCCVASV
jgi:hypothetical protein